MSRLLDHVVVVDALRLGQSFSRRLVAVRQKTTLLLKAGLDDPKDDDKSVSSSDKPGYDSEEVNTNLVDDTEVKKVDDDVNDKKVDNEDDD